MSRLRREDSTTACLGEVVVNHLIELGKSRLAFREAVHFLPVLAFWQVRPLEGVKKKSSSDWDFRNRSNDDEGADTVRLEPGLISSQSHG